MIKQDLVMLLKQYKENKARLRIKLKELNLKRISLKALENIDTSLSSAKYELNSDIHSKNQISDSVGNRVAKKEDEKLKTQQEITDLEKEVQALREKVEAVEDRLEGLKYKEREILTAYYVEGRTAEDIGNKLYFTLFNQTRSPRHIQRLIKRYTDKILKL